MNSLPGRLLIVALLWGAALVAAQSVDVGTAAIPIETRGQLPEAALLDVGIQLFDAGIPDDVSTHSERGIFPDIREAESRYMPVSLRRALVGSNAWGVVRVVPEQAEVSELLLRGRIVESTGLRLELVVTARDATGRLWFERRYARGAGESDYPVPPGSDPHDALYHRVANDLLSFREGLAQSELVAIRRVALLRYAAGLAPEAFAEYLGVDEAGHYSVLRLPAEGDTMASRVERIRNQEYLFIDNVDEQYTGLYREMAPTYDLWRQYDREQTIYRAEYQERAATRERHGRKGSFSAMEQAYNAYKLTRIQEQDLEVLARGFNNETAPTIVKTSGRVFRLTGTLDSQYQEWREILREIFALEVGLPQ